ncbi:unnamed protein product [Owenia fusiformis]|uniref:UDP-glucuronosyltransferase n=1 Tax=Owenia fusiformis TaxID=6347 RepID=A0A8S4Q587_OWEFU|nr:unnamed protein product [Owenia fusiformis]
MVLNHWDLKLYIACWLTIACQGANILITPVDVGYNSRMMNMFKLGRILLRDGHNITMLYSNTIHNQTLFKLVEDHHANKAFNVITYKEPPVERLQLASAKEATEFMMNTIGMPASELLMQLSGVFLGSLNAILGDHDALEAINKEQFDLIIADDHVLVSRVLGDYLNIPVITCLNMGPFSLMSNTLYPFNPSYMPIALHTNYSDTMTFWERIMNTWESIKLHQMGDYIMKSGRDICLKHGLNYSSCDNIINFYQTVSLVFMFRSDVLHYPAPFMPHVVSIEAFFLDKHKPLPDRYNDILNKANEHGAIIVSFGSSLRYLPMIQVNLLAKAFGKMPQRVIWSYAGPKPDNLGSNTVIDEWIPQNDLIVHPNVKLFVHHCGVSSTYQALSYGLPYIGIPFLFDQRYNCEKLTNRVGSGLTLNPLDLTSETLQGAMEDVINTAIYRENARKGAALYHDQPMDLRDKLVYWVNYVIQHNGANHLRSEGINKLNIFQYFLLDIICLILGIILLILFCIYHILVLFRYILRL